MNEARAAPTERPSFPVGLTVATAIALAILVGLGVWQLQRLKWKEGLLAHVSALQHATAQPLAAPLRALSHGADVEYTRVSVACPGLASAPFLEVYDLRDGEAGSRLVSVCPIVDDAYGSILVDRGFLPDTDKSRPPVDAGDRKPVQIDGVLRKPERGNFMTPKNRQGHWFTHEVAPMAKALAAPAPAPVLLYAETSSNPQLANLRPAPLPAEIPNNHFQYALTWFGLAGALAGVYLAALVKRLRG
jgi:surfeit locus 1 family protein